MWQPVGPEPLLQKVPVGPVVGVRKFQDLVAHHVLQAGTAEHLHHGWVRLPDNQVGGDNFLSERRVFKYRPEPFLLLLPVVGFGLLRLRHRPAGAQLAVFFV